MSIFYHHSLEKFSFLCAIKALFFAAACVSLTTQFSDWYWLLHVDYNHVSETFQQIRFEVVGVVNCMTIHMHNIAHNTAHNSTVFNGFSLVSAGQLETKI